MAEAGEGGVPGGGPMKGAYGEGNASLPLKPCAEEGRSCKEESADVLPEERGGRGSGLPGCDWKGKLKEEGGGRRMKISWEWSLGASRMSWEDGRLRSLVWLEGLRRGGGCGRDMGMVTGERSRSDSEFSEFVGDVMDVHEERSVEAMKRGRGGAREAESSAEDS